MTNKGFSLVEMSIGVVISSIVFISFMTMYVKFVQEDQEAITKQKLDIIEKAISNYAEKNAFLPCPASLSAAPNSSAFGAATDCFQPTAAGTSEVGSGDNAVRVGGLPLKALGLDESYNYDGWKNRFTYAIGKNLAINGEFFATYPLGGFNSIIVRDKNGNNLHTSSDVAYVVLSHGQKGSGATNLAGTSVNTCDVSLEQQNCNGDGIFIDSYFNPSTNSSDYYDDLVRWKTRVAIIKKAKIAVLFN